MKSGRYSGLSLALLPWLLAFFFTLLCLRHGALADEAFKLGVEEKGFIAEPEQGYEDYPAPEMVAPFKGGASQGGLRGSATSAPPRQQPPPRQPIRGGASVSLPPQFLGVWQVQGRRTKVDAQPQFRAGAEQAFAMSTNNTWQIAGSPAGGYTMANNQGVRTALSVVKAQGGTAWIRYQHQVGNTMAQEAIVLTLEPGGALFKGLERISIVKQQGQPPRAQVQYELVGRRQQ